MEKKKYIPRGIRNNNPLNIRIGNHWKGEVEHPTDTVFEQFTSMEYGCRAGFILLYRYMNRYGLRTILDIISRWAPATENNSSAYAAAVAKELGIGILDRLDFEDGDMMVSLVNAMIFIENGQRVPLSAIQTGYLLAWNDVS